MERKREDHPTEVRDTFICKGCQRELFAYTFDRTNPHHKIYFHCTWCEKKYVMEWDDPEP